MKKPKVHKLTIRNCKGAKDRVSHGAVTEVLLDGRKLRGITSVSYRVATRDLAHVTVEMFANVNIKSNLPKEFITVTQKEI